MKAFWFTGQRLFNHWLIEQRDIGTVHLLANGVERRIDHSDVGLLYVVDAKGDRLEVAPHEAESDDDTEEAA